MKYKYELNWWDQYDQDRWISSAVLSLFVAILTFVVLKNIHLPELPKKPPIIEEFVFVEEKVQKKITPQKVNPIQEKIPQEIFDEEPEVVVEIFEPIQDQMTNLPQDLPSADQFQIFEEQNNDITVSAPEFTIADGEIMDQSEEADVNLPDGFESDWTQENVPTTVITSQHGDKSNVDISIGISTTIRMEQKNTKAHFAGFKGNIDWSEIMDPLLDWIGKNSSDIGLIPKRLMTNNDATMKTAKHILKVGNNKFELLLASKESKRQVTICMIDVKTNEFVLLIDQGLTQKSSIFKFGTVRRDKAGRIVEFNYQQKRADSKLAKERMGQFWGWAKTLQ